MFGGVSWAGTTGRVWPDWVSEASEMLYGTRAPNCNPLVPQVFVLCPPCKDNAFTELDPQCCNGVVRECTVMMWRPGSPPHTCLMNQGPKVMHSEPTSEAMKTNQGRENNSATILHTPTKAPRKEEGWKVRLLCPAPPLVGLSRALSLHGSVVSATGHPRRDGFENGDREERGF